MNVLRAPRLASRIPDSEPPTFSPREKGGQWVVLNRRTGESFPCADSRAAHRLADQLNSMPVTQGEKP